LKIALIGADGQLGSDLQKVIPASELIPLTLKDVDITDAQKLEKVLLACQPDIVINTAAYHNVDACEDNLEAAFKVNVLGVKNLCRSAQKNNIILVHFSTDYVFDGEKTTPYSEADCPRPVNAYGISKLAGELYIRSQLERYFIVRSAGLYGVAGCMATGRLNFVEIMLKLAREKGEVKVVDDQIVSPTYTLDLARKVYGLVQTEHYGIFHLVNHGQCSWYEFAKKIFELTQTKVKLEKTTTAAFGARARRPAYSALDNARLRALGMDDMREWEAALGAYLQEMGKLGSHFRESRV